MSAKLRIVVKGRDVKESHLTENFQFSSPSALLEVSRKDAAPWMEEMVEGEKTGARGFESAILVR